jgi:hypothetical protein
MAAPVPKEQTSLEAISSPAKQPMLDIVQRDPHLGFDKFCKLCSLVGVGGRMGRDSPSTLPRAARCLGTP